MVQVVMPIDKRKLMHYTENPKGILVDYIDSATWGEYSDRLRMSGHLDTAFLSSHWHQETRRFSFGLALTQRNLKKLIETECSFFYIDAEFLVNALGGEYEGVSRCIRFHFSRVVDAFIANVYGCLTTVSLAVETPPKVRQLTLRRRA